MKYKYRLYIKDILRIYIVLLFGFLATFSGSERRQRDNEMCSRAERILICWKGRPTDRQKQKIFDSF